MPFCPMCGAAAAADHRYCARCGVALPRAVSTAVARSPAADESIEGSATVDALVHTPRALARADVHAYGDLPAQTSDAIDPSLPLASIGAAEPGTARRLLPVMLILVLVLLSAIGAYLLVRRGDSARASAPRPAARATTGAQATGGAGGAPVAETEHPAMSSTAAVWTVIPDETRDVTAPEEALGRPDGRMAVIAPGGSLALAFATEQPFYNGDGADVRVDGAQGGRGTYGIFARLASGDAWRRFDRNRRGFAPGFALHDFGHHGLQEVRQLLIRNEGTTELAIDAVTPLHRAPEPHEAHEAHAEKGHAR